MEQIKYEKWLAVVFKYDRVFSLLILSQQNEMFNSVSALDMHVVSVTYAPKKNNNLTLTSCILNFIWRITMINFMKSIQQTIYARSHFKQSNCESLFQRYYYSFKKDIYTIRTQHGWLLNILQYILSALDSFVAYCKCNCGVNTIPFIRETSAIKFIETTTAFYDFIRLIWSHSGFARRRINKACTQPVCS